MFHYIKMFPKRNLPQSSKPSPKATQSAIRDAINRSLFTIPSSLAKATTTSALDISSVSTCKKATGFDSPFFQDVSSHDIFAQEKTARLKTREAPNKFEFILKFQAGVHVITNPAGSARRNTTKVNET
jgi:hypothetical protein